MSALGMNALVSLNRESLEDALQIREWGKWAWEGNGTIYPGWVHKIKNRYPEHTKREQIPDIDPDYAYELDTMIAGSLDQRSKVILVESYVNLCSDVRVAQVAKLTRHQMRQDRDAALGFLYGLLCAKSA